MPSLRTLLSAETASLKRVLIAGAVLVAIGVVIIVVGVLEGWGQTRLFGAGLISIGGVLGGFAIGFSEPLRGRVGAWLTARRMWIAVIAAIIMAAPAVVATASGAVGPLAGGGNAKDTLLVAVGALFGLLFGVVTVVAAVIAVRATYVRVGTHGKAESADNAGEERA